jgi:two-component system, OmpR family, sensor histidine kinase KdpD
VVRSVSRVPQVARALAATIAVVAACTLLIASLDRWVPARSAGVVYLAAVLLVSSRYGLVAGVSASVLSVAAFNFFFLPPLHTFTLRESSDWLVLALFLVAALVTSRLAARARDEAAEAHRRAAETELALRFTTLLAQGTDFASVAPALAHEAANAIGAEEGRIVLPPEPLPPGPAVQLELDGAPVAVLVLASPPAEDPATVSRVAGVVAGLVVLARERDRLQAERVETETIRRSDELKTALLRAVSHDLRSPLQAITAAVGTLRLSLTEPDDRELADTVLAEAERLNRLVADLLDLSRMQAGVVERHEDWCDVSDIVRAGVREAGAPGGANGFVLDVPRDLPLVRGDARQLERVLVNLLDNGAKFAADGPVEVVARPVDHAVAISVLDRGPGIDAADREHIFEPFYRGRAGRGRAGSGLGLAIVRGLAEANHATVSVEDRPGGGAAFTLTVPTGQ